MFILWNTEEWRVYAEDFRTVRGADPIPNKHRGYWFFRLGEAHRPGHQRSWNDPNAYGAAKRQ